MIKKIKSIIRYYFYTIFFNRYYLNYLAEYYGLERQPWETDKQLKARIKSRI